MFGKKILAYSVSTLALMSGAAFAQADAQMETVVVTGIRATISQGLDVKRESTQVVESIIAEDIGKLPDNNVVEALQRLSGVQVTNRGGGQVGALYIRGLPDVETTWNGRKLFTSSGLYFSVQDMPATLVRRLDVYKTRESNQIETGIAGQIDVASYRPFDFDGFKLTGQVNETYQEFRGSFDPNIGLLISDRWKTGIGDIGVLANVNWSVVRFRDESATPGALVPFAAATTTGTLAPMSWYALQRILPSYSAETNCSSGGAYNVSCAPLSAYGLVWQPGQPGGLSQKAGSYLTLSDGTHLPYYLSRDAVFMSDFTGKRTRPNANLAVQWAPNEHAEYTFEVMYNGYRNETYNNLFFNFVDWWGDFPPGGTVDPATSITLYDGTNVMKTRHVKNVYGFTSGDLTVEKTNSYVYALNAKWTVSDRLSLTADASFQTSIFDTQFFAMRIDRGVPDIYVDFNAGGGNIALNFGDGQNRITDPSYWNTAGMWDNGGRKKGNAYTAQFDGSYDLKGIAGPLQRVRFGVRYDDRNATEAYRGADQWHGQALTSLPKEILHYNSDFFDGEADVPSSWVNVDGRYIWDHRDELRQIWGGNILDARRRAMFQNFKIDEVTTSAYLEGDLEQDIFGRPLTLNAGVRYVQVKDQMTFWNRDKYLLTGIVESSAGSAYTAKFLPSATLAYEPMDDVKVRLNYGETLRRPNFSDLNPTRILNSDVTNIGYGTGTQGNPSLQPTHSKNIDLTAEWYFAPSSALYGTLFRRDIQGLVLPLNMVVNVPGADIYDTYNTNNFIINMPVNASKGALKGVELGFVYFPDYLPSYLDGLGAQGSLTILSSSQNRPVTDAAGNIVREITQNFIGVSNTSYNATLIYEKDAIGARLSYVWRSKFYYGDEAANFANPLGIWRMPESSLDFQLSYKAWDNVMFTFDAVNLLKGDQRQYYAGGGQGNPTVTNFGRALFSRTFSVGLHYSTN
jgi:TonB-dependent receptor